MRRACGGEEQRQQQLLLQPDSSRTWAVVSAECSTGDERIALTRRVLAVRLVAARRTVGIGKLETRGRDLLRAARKPIKELAPAA